jgi:ABC-type antimicrobial peptide transport system permease subunit
LGIRLALGDTPAGIIALIAAGHAVTVLGGLLAGSLVAAAAVRVISAYLYGVTPYDAGTWLLAACVVFVAAAAGALVPALRAGAINPVEALRAE